MARTLEEILADPTALNRFLKGKVHDHYAAQSKLSLELNMQNIVPVDDAVLSADEEIKRMERGTWKAAKLNFSLNQQPKLSNGGISWARFWQNKSKTQNIPEHTPTNRPKKP